MKHNFSFLLVGYWSGLRTGRELSNGTDLDKRIIDCLAPNIFILEIINSGEAIYRIAGHSIRSQIGHNPQGRNFFDYWDCRNRKTLKTFFETAIARDQPLCLSSVGPISKTEAIELETVLVPVTILSAQKKNFIGTSFVLGQPGTVKLLSDVQHLQRIGFVENELRSGE